MTNVAEHLDRKLKSLPPAQAASVERLVWDVLQVVEPASASRSAAIQTHGEHIDRCLAMAAELDWTGFERPGQGVSEIREDG